jgi:putative glutamine amidotransferase
MPPRIAISMPHSVDREYAERAMPQYERAVEQAGGEPVRIPLDKTSAEVRKIVQSCNAVLLPGSNADVDPSKFRAVRSPRTAAADPARDSVDNLLLQDAYDLRKPILGICYGLQSLNVYQDGSLIQHIPDFLPKELRTRVNHEAGKTVPVAHAVEIERGSKLAEIINGKNREEYSFTGLGRTAGSYQGTGFSRAENSAENSRALVPEENKLAIPVNSSHHQSADVIGKGLRVSARCVDDGIIEALEGTASDHFVLAVQWHPERSVDQDEPSRAIFRALIQAAAK